MLEGIGESLQPACYRASASRQFGMFSPIRLYPQLETQEASQVGAREESLIDNPC